MREQHSTPDCQLTAAVLLTATAMHLSTLFPFWFFFSIYENFRGKIFKYVHVLFQLHSIAH